MGFYEDRGKSTTSYNQMRSSFDVVHTLGLLVLHKRGTRATLEFHRDLGREMGN